MWKLYSPNHQEKDLQYLFSLPYSEKNSDEEPDDDAIEEINILLFLETNNRNFLSTSRIYRLILASISARIPIPSCLHRYIPNFMKYMMILLKGSLRKHKIASIYIKTMWIFLDLLKPTFKCLDMRTKKTIFIKRLLMTFWIALLIKQICMLHKR